MAKDLLIQAGISFNPKDIDTKAIRNAIVKSLANVELKIAKATFSKDSKEALRSAFSGILFSVSKARMDSAAKSSLQENFSNIAFVVQRARFGASAINGLKNSFGAIQLTIGQANVSASVKKAVQQAAVSPTPAAGAAGATVAAGSAASNASAKFKELIRTQQEILNSTTVADRALFNYQKSLISTAGSAETFGVKIGQITTRFTAYILALKAILGVQAAFVSSLRFVFDFDSALQDLQKVIRETPEGLEKISDQLFGISARTATSFRDAATSLNEFVRSGLSVEEALRRTEAALIAVNVTGLSLEEATRLITSSLVVFKDELKDGISAIDLLTIADERAAASSSEIARGILRSGAAAESVGVSFKELNAITAATIEATQLSGSTIGAALKTIFANLAANSKQLREQANAFGANIQAGDGLFTVLEKLSTIFPTLNKEQVAVLNQVIAGKRRFTELTGLLGNFGKVNELLVAQNNSTGVALQRNEIELQKLSARAKIAVNSFQELIAAITGIGRGKEDVGAIRDVLKDSIDFVASFAQSLTSIVEAVKDTRFGFVELDSILKTIVKAAFFTFGVQVIKGIISGFRAFLSLSNAVTLSLQNNANAQGQVLRGVNQVAAAQQQTLSIEQKRLRTLQEIKQISGQIPTIKQPPTAGGGASPAGFSVTNQKLQLAILTAAFAGIQALGDNAREISVELKKNGQVFASNFASAAASAIELGTAIGFMSGPIAGLALGLTTLTFSLVTSSIKSAAASKIAEESFKEVSERSLSFGQAISIGGDLGKQVFERLSGSGSDLNNTVVNASSFFKELNKVQEEQIGSLENLSKKTSDFANSLTNAVEGISRRLEIRKEFQQAAEDFSRRAAKIKFEIETGDIRGQVNPIRDSIIETNAQLEKLKVVGGEIEGVFSRIQRVTNAVNDAQDQVNKTSFDILSTNGLTTKVLDDLTAKYNEARNAQVALEASENNVLSIVKSTLDAEKKRVEEIDKSIAKRKESLGASEEVANSDSRILSLNIERSNLNKKIADDEKNIQSIEKNLETSGSKLLDISSKREDLAKEIIKDLVKAQQAFEAQVRESALLAKASEANRKVFIDQSILLERELEQRRSIATAILQGGTLAQRAASEELSARENIRKQVEELASLQAKEINKLKELQSAAIRDNQIERARAFGEQINQLDKAAAEELDAFERKLNIQLSIDLIETNRKNIERSEQALLDFRLRAIDIVISRQQEAITREIDLIKQLGETVAGRDFLRKQFKPSDFDVREFGLIGGLIVKELEKSTDIAVQGMLSKLDQLRTGGLRSFEDLRLAVEDQKAASSELNDLIKQGADPSKIREAQERLDGATDKVREFANSGKDAIEIISQAQQNSADIVRLSEEENRAKREIILDRLKSASENVGKAEQGLVDARNKIPALNASVIDAEKRLATANSEVENATQELVGAFQAAADAQFRLNAEVILAEFKARQAVGSFSGFSEQIGFLRGSFQQLTEGIKASANTILEVRRQILQEELSLLQSQFNTIKGLAVEAAVGGPDAASQISQRIAAAQAIARGASIGQFPPELLQGIEQLFGVIDGLEEAVTTQGLEAIGLPAGALEDVGTNIIEVSKAIAETGKSQVDQAIEQTRLTQEALFKADEQKIIAEQELELSRSNRDIAVKTGTIAAENLANLRLGFRELSTQSIRQIESLSTMREQLKSSLDKSNEILSASSSQIDELVRVSKEQLSALQTFGGKISAVINAGASTITGAAKGSLTSSEFFGMLNAARKEKMGMPPGSNLMLANTSEVVLTKRQAKMLGLNARPISHAQDGNADFTGVQVAAGALTAASSALLNKLNQPGFIQQNITVQLDQQRRLEVKGLDGIDSAVRTAFETRMAKTATKEEQQAVSEIVQSIIARLSEQGIVTSQGT